MNQPRLPRCGALGVLLAAMALLVAAAPPCLSKERIRDGEKEVVAPRVYTARGPEIARLTSQLAAANRQSFEAGTFLGSSGKVLNYRLFEPKRSADAARRFPLVLVLHGAGARGTDNLTQITGGSALGAGLWTLPEHQRRNPCYVLAPQCPPEPEAWIKNTDWRIGHQPLRQNPSGAMAMVIELLDRMVEEYPVDPQRIYVTGVSMGGYGTWDLLARFPERFAAAAPVCGALADDTAWKLTRVPAWIFHGSMDDVVSATSSQVAYDDLRKAGGQPRYTEYDKAGHGIAGFSYTEPGLVEWMFAQKRRAAP